MVIHMDKGTETIYIGYSKREILDDLKGLYTDQALTASPESKQFEVLDSSLPFVASFVHGAMCEDYRLIMIRFHTKDSELRHPLNPKRLKYELAMRSLNTTQQRIPNYRTLLQNTFNGYYEIGLYALKFQVIDQIIED